MAVATRGETNKVLELARFKKRTFNIMCIYIVFLSSNIPFLCTAVLLWMQTEREVLILGVKNFAVTIIFFNSLVNPLLICWKMRDIRNAMKRLVCFMCRKYDWDRKLISFLSNFLSNVSILGVSALIQLFHFIPFHCFFNIWNDSLKLYAFSEPLVLSFDSVLIEYILMKHFQHMVTISIAFRKYKLTIATSTP